MSKIRCNWCDETFAIYAKLYVHQMLTKDETSKCPKHPDVRNRVVKKVNDRWG